MPNKRKTTKLLGTIPVIPSEDIKRDLQWYEKYLGFTVDFSDGLYAGISRETIHIHLQWHADTEDDPLLGGSVVKIFVAEIQPLFDEFVSRGTVSENKLRRNTPWNTHEFGFFDLNKNAIFFVEVIQ